MFLKGHVVPKADGGEGNEAVVVGMEVAPALIVREGGRPHAEGAYAGEETDGHHVGHGHLRSPQTHAFLGFVKQEADKGVDAFTQALEHHQG